MREKKFALFFQSRHIWESARKEDGVIVHIAERLKYPMEELK